MKETELSREGMESRRSLFAGYRTDLAVREVCSFAENEKQKAVIQTLIDYYKSGDLKTFDAYAVLWVKDTDSEVDFVNGFTETYGDPLGMKASWEATVNFINKEATKRTKLISDNAQCLK